MALKTLDSADKSKLHAEVNQYLNQRFTVAMTAIALFGVGIGLMVNGLSSPLAANPNPTVRVLTLLIAVTLLIVLGVLFVFSQVLLGCIHVITAYLCVSDASGWEQDYKKFFARKHKPKFSNQADSQALLFGVLGAITGIAPLICSRFFASDGDLSVLWIVLAVITFTYLLVVCLTWLGSCLDFGRNAEEIWQGIKDAKD